MHRKDAIAWVLTVCATSLRLSQAKTLAIWVASAMRVERISLANIGRRMHGRAKHQIKRAYRFCANERIETADAMRGIVKRLLKHRHKPLLVALDWVDIRGFQTLVVLIVPARSGRSTPLCWASCVRQTYDGHKSRNSFEESLLTVLREMIPRSIKVVILADRGFGRCALAAFLRQQQFSYLIRIQPKVRVKLQGFEGNLLDYPLCKGVAKVLKDVAYRSDGAVRQNIVIRWRKDLPAKRDECWFLMTDLNGTAQQLCQLYGKRMTIEQLFRDHKSKRNGWSLRDTQLTTPDRLDRLLLVLAIAYLLLCGIGLIARQTHAPAAWSSSSKNSCSLFLIGLLMAAKINASPQKALSAIVATSESVTGKWG